MTPHPPKPSVAPVALVAPSTGIEGAGVDGLDLILDDLASLLSKYVSFPSSEALWAVAAWVVHSWCIPEIFDSTPRLAVLSPVKRSGKTRLLEVLELVVQNPIRAANISPAAMYRAISMKPITPLIDEADTVWGTQKSERNEDLRGLVNGGHRRGSFVLRVNNRKGGEVEKFETFAPVVLAGIGDLPDTILDRSIVITMRRRLHNEKVEPFRMRKAEAETEPLKTKIEQWVNAHGVTLSEIEPVLPDGIEDRAADVWEPLVIIGDQAGERWSQRLRQAAKVLNAQRVDADESLGIKLLKDCQSVFENAERLTSSDLLNRLTSLEESPWSDLYGKCLTALGLSKRLAQFGIKPGTHRFGDKSLRGYLKEHFMDTWGRYLEVSTTPEDPQHPQQVQQDEDRTPFDEAF